MKDKTNPIIDIEQLNTKLKSYNLTPIQVKEIRSSNFVILESELDKFLSIVKESGQTCIFVKYEFYDKEKYVIPKEWYDEHPKEFRVKVNNHNRKLDTFDFDSPKELNIFILRDGVFIGKCFKNDWLKEKNISSADQAIEEIDLNFRVYDTSRKKEDEEELREIILNDSEFKYCKNQDLRYWYLTELLEQEDMEKYRYLVAPPGVSFRGKVKMFMDRTWMIYKEEQKK